MEENLNLESVSGEENVYDSTHYIEAIKEMKQNSVSRSEYNKLKEENKNLLKSLVNGETIDQPVVKEPVDIDKLRHDLYSSEKDFSNLEYITKVMTLREALLDKGDADPFLPKGHNISVTDQDIKSANKVAEVFNHCIEYADGNSEVFTNELMRLTQESFRPNLIHKR